MCSVLLYAHVQTVKKTTGYFRDGFCTTGPTDAGTHTVCAVMTREFLDYTFEQGNDLITPRLPFFLGSRSRRPLVSLCPSVV